MARDNRFVITGGPGLGKSDLVAGLRLLGYDVHKEAARAIIESWRLNGSQSPSPWDDRQKFDTDIERIMLAQYEGWEPKQPSIYDRGLPDLLAWKNYLGKPVDDRLRTIVATHPYDRRVFVMPEWAPWYRSDEDRPFERPEAFEINRVIRDTYANLGYELVELPRGTVGDRVEFVSSRIGRSNKVDK